MRRADGWARRAACAALALWTGLGSGCAGAPCGPGTTDQDGRCVAVCAPGAERDPATGACRATCVEGTRRDEASGACLPPNARCVSGEVWDVARADCVDVRVLCGEGNTWVAGEGRCVADGRLRAADRREGAAENDPTHGGDDAVERMDVPALGAKVTLAGTVEIPADRNGDGWQDADFDWWVFEATGPVLLRVTAEGLGGSSSGFEVLGLDGELPFVRIGLGTSGGAATRDVYLPRAGRYALVASDALNFLTRSPGPFHGGPGFGYFVTVERRPVPTATELRVMNRVATAVEKWPAAPPAEGSMLGFYALQVPAHAVVSFELSTDCASSAPELLVVGPDGPVEAVPGRARHGFATATPLLLVADYVYLLAAQDALHGVEVRFDASRWVEDELAPAPVSQPAWDLDHALPWQLFGSRAGAGEVVTVRASSDTGQTCWEMWDARFQRNLGRANCEAAPWITEPVSTMRFRLPADDFFAIEAVDWAGAQFDRDYVASIPMHEYRPGLAIEREAPEAVGAAPWAATGRAVGADGDERWFESAAPARVALRGRVTGGISPRVTLYEPHTGKLVPARQVAADGFVWRSLGGPGTVLGVADEAGAGGTFDLRFEPLQVPVAGTVSAPAPLQAMLALEAGERSRLFEIRAAGHGVVSVRLAPPEGLDLALVHRDGSLAVAAERDLAGPGEAETLGAVIGTDGLFLEVKAAEASAARAQIALEAALAPGATEAEPNDSDLAPQRLDLPAVVAANVDFETDTDWYRVETDRPVWLVATTQPYGDSPVNNPAVLVGDANGARLAVDDDSGPALHGRVEIFLERGGSWLVAVAADPVQTGGYLLDIHTREP